MKPRTVYFIVSCLIITLAFCSCDNTVYLFNGKNLDNWTKVLVDSTADQDVVFRAEDGLLKISGLPNGYIRTNESYSDYQLHVEWRWTAEPKNSGVLLHMRGEDIVWPLALECQLATQNAGNIILMGEGMQVTVRDSSYVVPQGKRFQNIPKLKESNEKPAGEWNTYDIVCMGDNIEVTVNGELQNRGSKISQSSGHICLQSEGGPIEFRNITLVPIK